MYGRFVESLFKECYSFCLTLYNHADGYGRTELDRNGKYDDRIVYSFSGAVAKAPYARALVGVPCKVRYLALNSFNKLNCVL